MNMLTKVLSPMIILSSLMASSAYAGSYSQEGYINWVKANNSGSTCFLELRYGISETSKPSEVQRGYWSCDNIPGQNVLNLAKTAKLLNLKVTTIFESGYEDSKKIQAITIY